MNIRKTYELMQELLIAMKEGNIRKIDTKEQEFEEAVKQFCVWFRVYRDCIDQHRHPRFNAITFEWEGLDDNAITFELGRDRLDGL